MHYVMITLLDCLPWSHGTLGFLVALELQIIKIKPYVHVEYIPVSDIICTLSCVHNFPTSLLLGSLTRRVLRANDAALRRAPG